MGGNQEEGGGGARVEELGQSYQGGGISGVVDQSPRRVDMDARTRRGGSNGSGSGAAPGSSGIGLQFERGGGEGWREGNSEEEQEGPEETTPFNHKQRALQRKLKRKGRARYELGTSSSTFHFRPINLTPFRSTGTSLAPAPTIHVLFSSDSSYSDSSASGNSGSAARDASALFRPSSDASSYAEDSSSSHRLSHRTKGQDQQRFSEVIPGEGGSSNEASSVAETSEDEDGAHGEIQQFSMDEFSEKSTPDETVLLRRMYGCYEDGCEIKRQGDPVIEEFRADVGVQKRFSHSRRASEESVRTLTRSKSVELLGLEERLGKERVKEEEEQQAAEGDDESPPNLVARESFSSRSGITPPVRSKHHHPRQIRRSICYPLNSDTEFLTLLAQALSSIASLQSLQKRKFAQSVQKLAEEVALVSSPDRPRNDLYIWREIFSLWVESQIFESRREKDRGERSVEDAEEKLEWFVDQVAKRKLAKRMRSKAGKAALEDFIKLNVELLDMKKFQVANQEAARKILKKHDKRTSLNLSINFPQFIAAASVLSSSSGPLSVQGGASSIIALLLPGGQSLPHVLLATFTTTLLPIIPQVDDYDCAICGDVAFRPIRLSCQHQFCVRCLVKMQKRGQNACPSCRQPVVLRANASNLDKNMEAYLEKWFPREVKDKRKLNEAEASKEQLEESGYNGRCCVQ